MNNTQVKSLLIDEVNGLMVQSVKDEFVITDARFLIKGHAGIIKILDSMKVDFHYLLKRQEIFTKEKLDGIKINDRKNPNNIEGMKFPDYKQIIPEDKGRIKAKPTDIIIEGSQVQQRVLIGNNGMPVLISNEYWKLFTEVMEINLDDCNITIDEVGGNEHAVIFNFDKEKSIAKSNSYILVMPIRHNVERTTTLLNQLKALGETEPIIQEEPIEEEVIDDTPSMDVPEITEEVVAVPESDITDGSSDDITTAAEMISDEDPLKITPEETQELFTKIKASKPYKSFDYSSKLIDILLTDNIEAVDNLNKDNRDVPATYKQTRALYRIIFGKHYSHGTLDALINEIH